VIWEKGREEKPAAKDLISVITLKAPVQIKATGAMNPMLNPNEMQVSSSFFSPSSFIWRL
jgi:hypothetical protein